MSRRQEIVIDEITYYRDGNSLYKRPEGGRLLRKFNDEPDVPGLIETTRNTKTDLQNIEPEDNEFEVHTPEESYWFRCIKCNQIDFAPTEQGPCPRCIGIDKIAEVIRNHKTPGPVLDRGVYELRLLDVRFANKILSSKGLERIDPFDYARGGHSYEPPHCGSVERQVSPPYVPGGRSM